MVLGGLSWRKHKPDNSNATLGQPLHGSTATYQFNRNRGCRTVGAGFKRSAFWSRSIFDRMTQELFKDLRRNICAQFKIVSFRARQQITRYYVIVHSRPVSQTDLLHYVWLHLGFGATLCIRHWGGRVLRSNVHFLLWFISSHLKWICMLSTVARLSR